MGGGNGKYLTWANQRREDKNRKRWNDIKRQRNIMRNLSGKSVSDSVDRNLQSSIDRHFSVKKTITLPQNCNFLEGIEELFEVINSLKRLVDSEDSSITDIYFDMKGVVQIDSASINIIISMSHYLNRIGINVKGNLPMDEVAKQKVIKSGFLNLVTTRLPVPETDDHIFTLSGNDRTNLDPIADEIKRICQHLLNHAQPYQPLYDTLGEIVANSVEHANEDVNDKNWYMSVHYDNDEAVIQMSDIGRGILGTLDLLLKQEIVNKLSLQRPHDTLKKLFEGKYQSRTREPNRNNGLPLMLERYKDSFIDNVIVVTNNALYDFSDSLSRTLNISFPGTFYSIRIAKRNIEKWQNRLN